MSKLVQSEWEKLLQNTTDEAHKSPFAHLLGHREGFCMACAEVYRSISASLIELDLVEYE